MEELLAHADDKALNIYNLISGLLMVGGLMVAAILWAYHRRNPPRREALSAQLVARAWSTGQVAILLGALLLLYFLASFSGLLFYEHQIPLAQIWITLLIHATLIVIITLINQKRGGSWQASCGMGFRQLKQLAIAPVFYLAIIPFLMVITNGYHFCLQQFLHVEVDLQQSARMMMGELSWLEVLYMVTAIFIAPLIEELLFRGILFPYFSKRLGMAGGTALVSVVFSALHFHIPSLVPLYLLSTALCLAYWRTGSLWTSIGIHTIFNAVTILALNVIG